MNSVEFVGETKIISKRDSSLKYQGRTIQCWQTCRSQGRLQQEPTEGSLSLLRRSLIGPQKPRYGLSVWRWTSSYSLLSVHSLFLRDHSEATVRHCILPGRDSLKIFWDPHPAVTVTLRRGHLLLNAARLIHSFKNAFSLSSDLTLNLPFSSLSHPRN